MAPYHTFMVAISFLYLLIIPSLVCFTTASKKPLGFSLKLIHRDSPESPLHPGNLTLNERMSRYAKWSVARASHLSSIITQNATIVDNPNTIMRPSVYAADFFYYMVTVGIGTPMQSALLLLDTGGDLTWTQCLPCDSCYSQKTPLYNSNTSTTFERTECTNPLCVGDMFKCDNGLCNYDIVYGGGSRTHGFAMNETLSFPTDDGHEMAINNLVVGCSNNNQDFSFDTTCNIGGIMGLNSHPASLVNQLDGIIHSNFSYCLSPDPILPAYLRFGGDIVVRGTRPVQRTPIVHDIGYFYGLILHDISIADIPLNYPPGTFAPKAGGAGGCFIDSGSPFTLIEDSAFNTFIVAFENFFAQSSGTPLVRNTKNCIEPTTYCYYTRGVKEYPSITYHFQEGANYTVPPENLIWHHRSGWFNNWFILTMIPGGPRTLLGAWHQHNVRIVYDLADGYLSFVPEDCTKDV